MSTDTMEELHHCRHCGGDFPPDKMRRDKSYASGFRPQCLSCKAKSEAKSTSGAKTATKRAPKQAVKKQPKPKKIPAEDRLYPCLRCERKDVPFSEMTKDKRKFMGVGSWCLRCRREREAELREQAKQEQERKEREAELRRLEEARRKQEQDRRQYADEWEFCYKCNVKARPGVLRQPPSALAVGYPEDAMLCAKCVTKAGDRADWVRAERKRMGIPENATRKEMESAVRVAALRELTKNHEDEYRQIYKRYMSTLGLEAEKKWITL